MAALTFACSLQGQSGDRTIDDAMDSFKGVAKQVKEQNPVLSTIDKKGGIMDSSLLKSIGLGRKSTGAGPIDVTLSKEQQEDVERRKKAAEKAELDAQNKARRPRTVMTAKATPKPAPAAPLATVLVTPVSGFTPPFPTLPPPRQINIVDPASLNVIHKDTDRATVITALGDPSSISAITGLEGGTRETLTYHLDPQHQVRIRLIGGKVQDIAR